MKSECPVKTVGTSLDPLTYRFEEIVEVSEDGQHMRGVCEQNRYANHNIGLRFTCISIKTTRTRVWRSDQSIAWGFIVAIVSPVHQ
jgi:hypothetical protein